MGFIKDIFNALANPRLFFDNSKKTIAKYALEDYMPKILKIAPEIDGFYIDSMGLWGDFTNYRQDHFAYARYPLAVDENGNPVSLAQFCGKTVVLFFYPKANTPG